MIHGCGNHSSYELKEIMARLDIHNVKGEKISEREIKDEIFNVPVKEEVVHEVVRWQLANSRSGAASTKNRSMVRGSGKKLWRQKGTGRARVGAASSPTRIGGGVAFGPSPRDYSFKVNRKRRKAALRMALTDKFKAGQMIVLDDFSLEGTKTKFFVDILKKFDLNSVLMVVNRPNEKLEKSSRNVKEVKLLRAEGLNIKDILNYKNLLFVEPALEIVEEVLSR